jgi:hypothetical protein
MPGVWIRPYGSADGEADDHLHVDFGYTLIRAAVRHGRP